MRFKNIIAVILPMLIVIACMSPTAAIIIKDPDVSATLIDVESALINTKLSATDTAAAMSLKKTEGDVSVSEKTGKPVYVREKMRLYDGYDIGTKQKSYAWIDLDREKLIKLDAVSDAGIKKSGENLEINLNSGKLFFNVAKPLQSDESLNISTSTLSIAIRGTCGWVEFISDTEAIVSILEGTVTVTITDLITGQTITETVTAGETVKCVVYDPNTQGEKCDIIRAKFKEDDIDGFVLTELVGDDAIIEKIYDATVGGVNLRNVTLAQALERLYNDQANVMGIMPQSKAPSYYTGGSARPYTNIYTNSVPRPAPSAVPTLTPVISSVYSAAGTADGSAGNYPYWDIDSIGAFITRPNSSLQYPLNPLITPSPTVMPPQQSGMATDQPQPGTTPEQPSVNPSADTTPSAQPSADITPSAQPSVDITPSEQPSADITPSAQPSEDTTPLPSVTALTLAEIQAALDRGENVTVPQAFTIDGALNVPAGPTLTFNEDVTIDSVGSLTVNGTVNVLKNFTNGGTVTVNSPNSLHVTGTLDTQNAALNIGATGKVQAAELLGEAKLTPGAVLMCQNIAQTPQVLTPDGYTLSEANWQNNNDGYNLYGYVVWNLNNGELNVLYVGREYYWDIKPWKNDMQNITAVNVADNTTCISSNMFTNCVNLTNVKLPDSVTTIGVTAFEGCTKLTEIVLPKSLQSIGQYAFIKCTNLSKITFNSGLTKIGPSSFAECTNLTELNFPATLNTISQGAFSRCTNLANINLPQSLTSIGDSAFLNCASLTSPNFPESLTYIGEFAFAGCDSFIQLNLPSGLKAISKGAFDGCVNLTQLNLPSSLTTIGSSAFYNCPKLTELNLPATLTTIENFAFENCTGITKLDLPSSLTNIGENVFANCTNLFQINFSEGLTDIGNGAFFNCKLLTELKLPNGLKTLGKSAFYNCTKLAEITLPNTITSIGSDAFFACPLTKVIYNGTQEQWAALSFSGISPDIVVYQPQGAVAQTLAAVANDKKSAEQSATDVAATGTEVKSAEQSTTGEAPTVTEAKPVEQSATGESATNPEAKSDLSQTEVAPIGGINENTTDNN